MLTRQKTGDLRLNIILLILLHQEQVCQTMQYLLPPSSRLLKSMLPCSTPCSALYNTTLSLFFNQSYKSECSHLQLCLLEHCPHTAIPAHFATFSQDNHYMCLICTIYTESTHCTSAMFFLLSSQYIRGPLYIYICIYEYMVCGYVYVCI